MDLPVDLRSLREAYISGTLTPVDVAEAICDRIDAAPPEIWIHRVARHEIVGAARALAARARPDALPPLYGVPFAVKDNIDVAGLPTTAACPAFSYVARESAAVVARLVAAGALLVGKTNMDQLATGLVGVRSPYGVPANAFDARYISGGSSSGSGVAVARGLVGFALGTDTAGSGRVPAGFGNVVGLKPSGGLLSTAGVVPACRSLDCVSIFALTVDDACAVAAVAGGHDPADPYSRPEADGFRWAPGAAPAWFRFGVPAGGGGLEFFGDAEAKRLFDAAAERLAALGGTAVPVDLQPFFAAARLLYDGPWIAERLALFESLVATPGAVLPVIADIFADGKRYAATELFRALHQLEALRAGARRAFAAMDVLLVPTTPTIYRIDEIEAQPRALNGRLGLYTNFVNLLGLAALAVPNGFRGDGLPSGITLIGPRDSDARLAALGAAFHRRVGGPLGATGRAMPAAAAPAPAAPSRELRVAVVGAHLAGQPLNYQLTELGARLVRSCRTARAYLLYALPGTVPPKPGLVRAGTDAPGAAIEVEVWEMARDRFGDFFARVPPPLCMGTIELEDGERVAGFLCEAHATAGARDISSFAGWRRYLAEGAARAS
jgi:allophanate hydrolase